MRVARFVALVVAMAWTIMLIVLAATGYFTERELRGNFIILAVFLFLEHCDDLWDELR